MQFDFKRPCRTQRHLHFFRGSFTQSEAVFLLDVVDDRSIDCVASDPRGLRRNYATKRDNGNFGRAAADIDDHVSSGFLNW
ncbi:unannotated protein [freshwater metagenome]|uniref:Unannotated protein n=1 Tax=freshwater metagenome TaxID=449393 RepID=A0A6J6AR19_9ZZZZ